MEEVLGKLNKIIWKKSWVNINKITWKKAQINLNKQTWKKLQMNLNINHLEEVIGKFK